MPKSNVKGISRKNNLSESTVERYTKDCKKSRKAKEFHGNRQHAYVGGCVARRVENKKKQLKKKSKKPAKKPRSKSKGKS